MKDQKIKIGSRTLEISNTDKLYYPKNRIKKGDILDYYCKISEYLLPHIKKRLLSMHRYPNGIEYQHFVQQEIPQYFPAWIDRKRVRKEDGYITHAICSDKQSLVYLANEAVLEFHIWPSRNDNVNNPDKLIFDLDPPKGNVVKARKAALAIKEILEEIGLRAYVMSTGSQGYHIVVPLDRKLSFKKTYPISEKIAKMAVRAYPSLLTTELRKEKRGGKVFVDYMRNSYGQTSIAPYSLRARKGAPIATPLSWEEMRNASTNPSRYDIKNIFRRLSRIDDPWKDINKDKQSLTKAQRKLDKIKK